MNGALHTHDPSAIAYVIDPGMFKTKSVQMFVETVGRCAGQTVPDERNQLGDFSEINICLDVDEDRFLNLYRQRMTQ